MLMSEFIRHLHAKLVNNPEINIGERRVIAVVPPRFQISERFQGWDYRLAPLACRTAPL